MSLSSTKSFQIRVDRRYSPGRSLLGRWLLERTGDRLHAEALYIVSVSGILLGLVFLNYLGWMLFSDQILASPSGKEAIVFWCVQLLLVGVVMATAAIGFHPSVSATWDGASLTVEWGSNRVVFDADDIRRVRSLSALSYHRTVRPYRVCLDFEYGGSADVLVVEMHSGTLLGLGLKKHDHVRLKKSLQSTDPAIPSESLQTV